MAVRQSEKTSGSGAYARSTRSVDEPAANVAIAFASIPTSDEIRRKAAEVVSRPEYHLDQGLHEGTDSLWLTIITWILKPFVWLFEALDGLPVALRVLVIVVLGLVAIALIFHIIWSLVASIRQSPGRERLAPLDRESLVDPLVLEAAARKAEADGEYLESVRLLFRAALRRIELAEDKKLRVGITNRELLRRYRQSPLSEPLQLFVEMIDRKWYGGETCESADALHCRESYGQIQTLTQGGPRALSA
ncbi:MAG: hypothetical protein KDA86_23285 [Planctomycetaceae bacterium]|nr:hypothetical protein [Planctomycetaceae bacterium]